MPDSPDPIGGEELHGVDVPLEIIPAATGTFSSHASRVSEAAYDTTAYSPERQRDNVRLILTCGLLILLGYLIVYATVESASTPQRWTQAKEMLQILFPALTGIIGTVIGFYFGTAAANKGQSSDS